MTLNPIDQHSCPICQQRFNSDPELQEHRKLAHSQQQGEKPSNPDQGDQKRERIA